jgi:hypothetical protein
MIGSGSGSEGSTMSFQTHWGCGRAGKYVSDGFNRKIEQGLCRSISYIVAVKSICYCFASEEFVRCARSW